MRWQRPISSDPAREIWRSIEQVSFWEVVHNATGFTCIEVRLLGKHDRHPRSLRELDLHKATTADGALIGNYALDVSAVVKYTCTGIITRLLRHAKLGEGETGHFSRAKKVQTNKCHQADNQAHNP